MAFPDGWAVRCPIDLAQTSETLADWTCVFNQTGLPADLFVKALEDGGDIRFSSDQDGTIQLPCHVRHFSASGGTANIAIKTNTSASAATRVYVWYLKAGESQPAPTDPFGRNAVYADSDYLAVWPLHEDPAGGGVAVDATGNGNDITAAAGVNSPSQVDGLVYKAWQFDQATPGEESYGTMADLARGRTFCAEVLRHDLTTVRDQVIFGGDGDVGNTWCWRSQPNFQRIYADAETSKSHTSNILAPDVWNHVGILWNVNGFKPFINGVDAGYGGGTTGTLTLKRLGLDMDAAFSSNGTVYLEELRICSVSRTVGWMSASSDSLRSPGTFFTVGTPEDVIGGLDTTITATNAAGSDVETFKWTEIPPP